MADFSYDSFEKVKLGALPAPRLVKNGKSRVLLVRVSSRKDAIRTCINQMSGWKHIFHRVKSRKVLLKPNLNTSDPFPASTHLDTIKIVTDSLLESGMVNKLIIGDSSGKAGGFNTYQTAKKIGIVDFVEQRDNVELSCFEHEKYVRAYHEKAKFWKNGMIVPRRIIETDNIVSLPAMKTHQGQAFTLSIKETVGPCHPKSREEFHASIRSQEMIAELCLTYAPKFVILDGTKCFITRGPSSGDLAEPRVMIAGDDRVAVDAVGVAVMKAAGSSTLEKAIWNFGQIRRASEIGIGIDGPEKILLEPIDSTLSDEFADFVDIVREYLWK
ncbi:MAG: DUF362 domain-containing protein [Candidatus Heimdallarchaeota archaeon]